MEKTYALFQEAGWDVDGTRKRLMNDDALYQELLLKYKKDTHLETLHMRLQEEDYEGAFLEAHTLKGIAANLGFVPMKAPADTLTELLRNAKEEASWQADVQEKMKALENAHKDVVALLEKLG